MSRFSRHMADYGRIVRLGLPILVGQLGMIVVAFADNIMVGRYSTDALASASFVNNVFNMAVFACVGFTYGLTPIVGALFSQNRRDTIGAMMRNAVVVNVVFALLVTGVMAAVYFNLHRLNQPEHLLPLIRPYFLLGLAGIVPVALFNVFAQWFYAINRTALPMWIVLGANMVNIAGNYMLIFGNFGCTELGLMGAGWSTLAARCLCAAVAMGFFFFAGRFREYCRGFLTNRVNWRMIGQINRTSWPVSLQMTLESASFSLAAVMAGWLGAISLAAFQIIVITGTLGFCVYYSMAAAVSVLVANHAGLDDREGMRRVAFSGYHIILALATVSSLIFIFFERTLISAFTEDQAVIQATVALIVPLVLYQFADATQIAFANALRGTSNVMPMMLIAFVSYIVFGLPATYLLGFPAGLGTYGIILSFSVSLVLAASLFFWVFVRTTRRSAR